MCNFCRTGKCCQKNTYGTGCESSEGADTKGVCVNANNCYHMEILSPSNVYTGYTSEIKIKCTNDALTPL